MSTSPASKTDLNPVAEKLLCAAEKLYAIKGLESVSTREIGREAGNGNNSAIQYHFGSREQLIEAILDFRMIPLNQRRLQLLAEIEQSETALCLRTLVGLFIHPFAEELLKAPEDSYYVSLLSQLYNRHQGELIFGAGRVRGSSLQLITGHMRVVLSDIPEQILIERLATMGRQVVDTVAAWDFQRRQGQLELTESNLRWRVSNLVDYIVGGLGAPASADTLGACVAPPSPQT